MKSIIDCKVVFKSLLFLFILLNPNFGFAQLFITNNVNVAVSAGTQLTVQGNFQNDNGATITNNGTIDLSGNWIHNAANNCFGMLPTAGTVILNGANQNIGGANSTTFNNLILIGSGTKTLEQNIIVGGAVSPNGVLSLGDRNLDLNSKTLTINNPLPTAITRNTSFIISETNPLIGYGYIHWNMGNAAAGNNFVFPFGNATTSNYLPFNFNVTTAGTGIGYVKLATYPTNTAPNPNNRPLPTGLTMLVNNSSLDNSDKVVDRFFIFDVSGYTTNPVSTMVFPYRDLEWSTGTNSIIEANLRLQRLNNGTQWTQPPFGNVNAVNNTVTAINQNTYSTIWTIVDLTSPLPISLLDFNAKLTENDQTELTWATSTESNSASIEVQKSLDAISFTTIETIEAQHYSNVIHQYKTFDPKPFSPITYYRLKLNDNNGDFSYSKTVSVSLDKKGSYFINVYPNPFRDYTDVQITSALPLDPESKISITNLLGQTVMETKLNSVLTGLKGTYRINRASLNSGVYYLNIFDTEKLIAVLKLVIQ